MRRQGEISGIRETSPRGNPPCASLWVHSLERPLKAAMILPWLGSIQSSELGQQDQAPHLGAEGEAEGLSAMMS